MSTNCRLERPTAVIIPAGRDGGDAGGGARVGPGIGGCPSRGEGARGEKEIFLPKPGPEAAGTRPQGCREQRSGFEEPVTEQSAEHPAEHGVGQGGEERREFADGPQQEHDPGAVLDHPPAPHLHRDTDSR